MLKCVASHLRAVVALMGMPDGDVKIKMYEEPKIKPPRRQTPTENVTNRSDYMQNYMKDYREHGKDYQKMPAELKKRRREQRKRQKEHIKHSNSIEAIRMFLIDQDIKKWQKMGRVDPEEYVTACQQMNYRREEKAIMFEDLCDLGLILY